MQKHFFIHLIRYDEWNGDWGIHSDKWNNETKSILKYKQKNNGNFWISYPDFLLHFSSLYIDFLLNSQWKRYGLGGSWTKEKQNTSEINHQNIINAFDQWFIKFNESTHLKCTFEKVGDPVQCHIYFVYNHGEKLVSFEEIPNTEENKQSDNCKNSFSAFISKKAEVTSFRWSIKQQYIHFPWTLIIICDKFKDKTSFYFTIYSRKMVEIYRA